MVSVAFETNVVRRRGVIESSSNDDGDGIENGKKINRFRLAAKQQLCTCITLFVHSLAVTARLRRETA